MDFTGGTPQLFEQFLAHDPERIVQPMARIPFRVCHSGVGTTVEIQLPVFCDGVLVAVLVLANPLPQQALRQEEQAGFRLRVPVRLHALHAFRRDDLTILVRHGVHTAVRPQLAHCARLIRTIVQWAQIRVPDTRHETCQCFLTDAFHVLEIRPDWVHAHTLLQ